MEEKSIEYKISDHIIKNVFETYDILIYKPEFSNYFIKNVQLYLLTDTYLESKILDGFEYHVCISGSIIFKSILKSGLDLFAIPDIPFNLLVYHKMSFIIMGISENILTQIVNWTIKFTWVESPNLLNPIGLFGGNIQHNGNRGFGHHEMDWYTGFEKDDGSKYKTELKFMAGMCGVTYNYNLLDEEYFDKTKSIESYSTDNNYLVLNYSHIDKTNNFVEGYEKNYDIYSNTKLLDVMTGIIPKKNSDAVNLNPDLKPYQFQIYSETCKFPIQRVSKLGKVTIDDFEYLPDLDFYVGDVSKIINPNNPTYKYIGKFNLFESNSDAISNIYLLCSNFKYTLKEFNLYKQINKSNNIEGEYVENIQINKIELEFEKTPNGYKISGLNTFLVIPLFCESVIIEIKFESNTDLDNNSFISNGFAYPDDLWIRFDRYALDTEIRRNVAKNYMEYEEYGIIDLIDYYSEKNLIG